MSIFNKLFGSKSNKTSENSPKDERGKHMPKVEIPVDEKFMIEFKENGGKFLYCSEKEEVLTNFNAIISENNWSKTTACIFNKELIKLFKKQNITLSQAIQGSEFLITGVEALVAEVGALLISSNQIAETNINEYPRNIIVFAKTSQIVKNIGEGLTDIKNKNKPKIPSNITTIKNFRANEDTDNKDFLTYGSNAKNVYLLLLEDL